MRTSARSSTALRWATLQENVLKRKVIWLDVPSHSLDAIAVSACRKKMIGLEHHGEGSTGHPSGPENQAHRGQPGTRTSFSTRKSKPQLTEEIKADTGKGCEPAQPNSIPENQVQNSQNENRQKFSIPVYFKAAEDVKPYSSIVASIASVSVNADNWN